MAVFNSYQGMIDNIKNELQRNDSDIDSIITNSISDAIRHFKDECFAVNQATFYTTATKMDSTKLATNPMAGAYVDLPLDFSSMINLQVNKDGIVYQMEEVTYPEIDSMDALYTDPNTGTPEYWSYFGEYRGYDNGSNPTGPATEDSLFVGTATFSKAAPGKIRIYRRPDKDYTLIMRYVSNLADPAIAIADGVFSPSQVFGFWMNEAYRMIKTYAKGIIYADYLQQYDQAQAQETLALAEFNRLVGRSESRALSAPVIGYI